MAGCETRDKAWGWGGINTPYRLPGNQGERVAGAFKGDPVGGHQPVWIGEL